MNGINHMTADNPFAIQEYISSPATSQKAWVSKSFHRTAVIKIVKGGHNNMGIFTPGVMRPTLEAAVALIKHKKEPRQFIMTGNHTLASDNSWRAVVVQSFIWVLKSNS